MPGTRQRAIFELVDERPGRSSVKARVTGRLARTGGGCEDRLVTVDQGVSMPVAVVQE